MNRHLGVYREVATRASPSTCRRGEVVVRRDAIGFRGENRLKAGSMGPWTVVVRRMAVFALALAAVLSSIYDSGADGASRGGFRLSVVGSRIRPS